jgi:hypothetical protein
MKIHIVPVLTVLVIVLAGCNPPAATNASKNDTWRLDETAKQGAQEAVFVDSVKQFYQALQNKDWPTTYDMRFSDYKHDVSRTNYLKLAAGEGRGWSLDSYRVLNLEIFGNTNGEIYASQIIMEFNEAGTTYYGAAWWRKEGGKWSCQDSGAGGPAWLRSIRPPPWLNE